MSKFPVDSRNIKSMNRAGIVRRRVCLIEGVNGDLNKAKINIHFEFGE